MRDARCAMPRVHQVRTPPPCPRHLRPGSGRESGLKGCRGGWVGRETGQRVTPPAHTEPLTAFTARARITSEPVRFGRRISTVNDPLGASVVRVRAKIWAPLSVSRTRQACPTRLLSTSNSTESWPSSGFALSFQVAPAQVPVRCTPGVPPLASAAGAMRARPPRAAVAAVSVARVRRAFMMTPEWGPPVCSGGTGSVSTECVVRGMGWQPSNGPRTFGRCQWREEEGLSRHQSALMPTIRSESGVGKGEVRLHKIWRRNGIGHRLTEPASSTRRTRTLDGRSTPPYTSRIGRAVDLPGNPPICVNEAPARSILLPSVRSRGSRHAQPVIPAWLPGGVLTVVGGGHFPGSLPLWAAALAFAAYLLALFGGAMTQRVDRDRLAPHRSRRGRGRRRWCRGRVSSSHSPTTSSASRGSSPPNRAAGMSIRTPCALTAAKETRSTSRLLADTVATVRQLPPVRTCSLYGAIGRASCQVILACLTVRAAGSETVRLVSIAGSVPDHHAVARLPSTAASGGPLGSAALALAGWQRTTSALFAPALRVGRSNGDPTEIRWAPDGDSTVTGRPDRSVTVVLAGSTAMSSTRPCQRSPFRCTPLASCGGSIGSR